MILNYNYLNYFIQYITNMQTRIIAHFLNFREHFPKIIIKQQPAKNKYNKKETPELNQTTGENGDGDEEIVIRRLDFCDKCLDFCCKCM
jgi:hypothetical protein